MSRLRCQALGLVVLAVFAQPASADVVTDWNHTAVAAMKVANTGGNPWTRNMAMMHVAMSDAVNSVQNKYAVHAPGGAPAPAASAEAAAAAAAKAILLQQLPGQKEMIEQAFDASMKAIPDNAARKDGIAIGEKCAAAIIADRASDGTSVPDTYRPVTAPGVWIPTTPPLFAEYARARPWVMKSADQVRPPPPPQLNSALYARDYNETREMGGATGTRRTPEQTVAVRFWTPANLHAAWQQVARQMSAAKNLPLAENARFFALLNMGQANTYITDWDAKFTYNFWRPVTAIRNGDQDGNDATERDAGWSSLNTTPMFPEYPSQAALVGGVSVAIFESVFGPRPSMAVAVTDMADSKRQRDFPNLQAMADEVKNVRIWGGVHFRNSLDVGYDMGRRIAVFMIENSLKPTN
jgi:hypothetical protein